MFALIFKCGCFVAIVSMRVAESSVNLARGKPTNASSEHADWLQTSNAVDGNTEQYPANKCFHSSIYKKLAWWMVDLEFIYNLEKMKIYYRDELNTVKNFIGYKLYFSNSSEVKSGDLFYSNVGKPAPSIIVEHTFDYLARYVTIYKDLQPTDGIFGAVLELCEVEIYGCSIGFYGENSCNLKCDECTQGLCNPTTGECKDKTSCADGYYGSLCKLQCPKNCKGCDFKTGQCSGVSCADGYFGLMCNKTCPKNCGTKACDFHTGNCTSESCIDGYYGQMCNNMCPENCGSLQCDFLTGNCSSKTCRDGFYGNACNQKCPENCGEHQCDFYTGNCSTETCQNGYFGAFCAQTCPKNCQNPQCDFSSGACTDCIVGLYGNLCHMECSPRCARLRCDISNGHCAGEACVDGYYGPTCNWTCLQKCSDSSCNFQTGKCNDVKDSIAIIELLGPVMGGVAVLISISTLVVVVICLINTKRRVSDQSKENKYTENQETYDDIDVEKIEHSYYENEVA